MAELDQLGVSQRDVEAFCRQWKVRELSLFGSALRDDFAPGSDVDLLVELPPHHELSLYDWVDMIDQLREIFGRDVDLVAKSGLSNPIRRREILHTAKVLYAA